ncbi:MAG: hypothetical protein QXL24_08765, partial [Candidatus Jordarchaeaceae archaeon]
DYFDSYFERRWNLSVYVRKDIINSVLWIPNSGIGNSVSKVNTINALELGRYYTVPSNVYGNPSRVAVDSKGNVWVGNRGTRTIVKIGLLENNQCLDKNGNGKRHTITKKFTGKNENQNLKTYTKLHASATGKCKLGLTPIPSAVGATRQIVVHLNILLPIFRPSFLSKWSKPKRLYKKYFGDRLSGIKLQFKRSCIV